MGLLTAPLTLAREPIRITLRVWEFGLSSAAEAARIGMELLDSNRDAAAPDLARRRPAEPDVVVPETGYVAPKPGEVGPEPDVLDVEETPPAAGSPAAVDTPPAVPDELIPDHVDEEAVLVAEVAEEGAQEGAGAELNVDPPWDGYDQMVAADILDRLAGATPAEAAAVELYESTRKSRRSVLDAAERALRG